MFSLINPTHLHTQRQLVLDAHGEDRLLLVVKGSFELDGEVDRVAPPRHGSADALPES